MAGHAQLKCIMTECSKTQICFPYLTKFLSRHSEDIATHVARGIKPKEIREMDTNIICLSKCLVVELIQDVHVLNFCCCCCSPVFQHSVYSIIVLKIDLDFC